VTERLWKSLTVTGKAAGVEAAAPGVVEGDASGDAAGPQAARRKSRTLRIVAKRLVIRLTPFTRRCGCRER
jgi:hypothetical protein